MIHECCFCHVQFEVLDAFIDLAKTFKMHKCVFKNSVGFHFGGSSDSGRAIGISFGERIIF